MMSPEHSHNYQQVISEMQSQLNLAKQEAEFYKNQLFAAESGLSAVLDCVRETALLAIDTNYCLLAYTDKLYIETSLNHRKKLVIGKSFLEIFEDEPIARERFKSVADRAMKGESFIEEISDPEKGIYLKVFWKPYRVEEKIAGATAMRLDVSSEKQYMAKINKLRRLYAVLSQINQTIVRSRSAGEVYRSVTQHAIEFGEFNVAWIGIYDENSGTITPVSQSGKEIDLGPILGKNLRTPPFAKDLIATALNERKVVFSDHLPSDIRMQHWWNIIPFQAQATVPFFLDGEIKGVLNLYSTDNKFFNDKDEFLLLEDIGTDISFALQTIENNRLRQQWADAFDNCTFGIAIGKPGSNLMLSCNKAFAEQKGFNREELQGLPILNQYPEEVRSQVAAHLKTAFEKGYVQYVSKKLRKDGSSYTAQIDIRNIFDQDGKMLYYIATDQDITEKKEIELKLKESEFKFRKIFENSPVGIALVNKELNFILVNQAFCKMLGYTEKELLSIGIKEVTFKDDLNKDIPNVQKMIRGEATGYSTEKRYVKKDGDLIWATLKVSPHYNNHNEFQFNIAIINDITATKTNEALLSRLTERLELAASSANIGIWDWNVETNTIIWDDQMYELYGIQKSDPPHAYEVWLNGIHPEDRQKSNAATQLALEGKKDFDTEFRVLWKDGHIHWLKAKGVVIRNKAGKPVRMLGINVDITEQKEAEELIHTSQHILSLFVEHAPAAIAMFDNEMKYIAVSNRFLSDFKLSGQNIIGQSHYDIFPEITDEIKGIHQECLLGKSLKSDQEPFFRQDGSVNWLRWEVHPWFHENGKTGGIILFSEVITERVLALEQLQKSEERYRSTLENIMEGCQIISFDWKYLFINKAAEKHNRRPKEDLLGRKYLECWPHIEKTEVYSAIASCMTSRVMQKIENKFIFPDGSFGWFQLSIQPIPEGVFILSFEITEEKEISLKLGEIRDHHSKIINQFNDIVWTAKLDVPEIIDLNDAFEKIYGISNDELKKNPGRWLELVHPDDKAIAEKSGEEVFMNEIVETEYRIIRPDGEIRWINDRKALLKDANNNIFALGGIAKDITLQKKTEFLIRETYQKLANAQRIAHIGSWEDRISTGEVIWSDEMYSIMGLTPGKPLLLEHILELFPEEEKEKYNKAIHEALQSHSPYRMDYRIIRPDQTERYIHEEGEVVFDEDGIPQMIYGTTQDITDRKTAELELISSREKHRSIIHTAMDGFWQATLEGNFLEVNEAFEQMSGYSKEELLTMRIADIEVVENPEEVANHISTIIETGSDRFETVHRRKDGSTYDVEISVQYKSNEKLLVVFIHDISERKRYENEILALNSTLEKKVVERTEQLLTSNKELEAFSYSVSHDLRAPLRAIDGFTRILIEKYSPLLDEEAMRLGNIIRENTQKMSKLIEDLLLFSRLSRQELVKSRIDMKGMVNAMYHEITTEVERSKVKFTVHDICDATGDPNLMRQVWANLLSNAVKYSSKVRNPEIHVRCKMVESTCVYQVQDNGAGFDMAYADKLFIVFQRLHNQKDFEGTGVGLASVQRIIQRHGGTIWAQSSPGKGASFYFTLT